MMAFLMMRFACRTLAACLTATLAPSAVIIAAACGPLALAGSAPACIIAAKTLGTRFDAGALFLGRRFGWPNPLHHGAKVFGQWQALKFGISRLANVFQVTALILAAKTDGNAVRSGARGAPDPVDILLGHIGQIEIDHMAHARNINPACRHIGRNQNRRFGALELVQCALALRLALVAMDRVRLNPALAELFHNSVRAVLGAGKDQNTLLLTRHLMPARQDHFEERLLLIGLNHEQILLYPLSRRAFGRNRDLHWIAAIRTNQFLDLFRHGRAEEQCLALFRGQLVDLPQGMDKAEVQHLVRLVQNEDFHRLQIERLLINQIQQTPRRCDQNICPAVQFVAVLIDRSAAHNRLHFKASKRAVILGALGNLSGQFAGGRKHQHAAGFERGLVIRLAQPVDRGQHERRRLAGAGLRDAEEVTPFQNGRNSLCLNRRRCGVILQIKRLQYGL